MIIYWLQGVQYGGIVLHVPPLVRVNIMYVANNVESGRFYNLRASTYNTVEIVTQFSEVTMLNNN